MLNVYGAGVTKMARINTLNDKDIAEKILKIVKKSNILKKTIKKAIMEESKTIKEVATRRLKTNVGNPLKKNMTTHLSDKFVIGEVGFTDFRSSLGEYKDAVDKSIEKSISITTERGTDLIIKVDFTDKFLARTSGEGDSIVKKIPWREKVNWLEKIRKQETIFGYRFVSSEFLNKKTGRSGLGVMSKATGGSFTFSSLPELEESIIKSGIEEAKPKITKEIGANFIKRLKSISGK